MRPRALLIAASIAIAVSSAAASAESGAAGTAVRLTPVARLPFPARGYVLDLPAGLRVVPGAIRVRENGRVVRNLDVRPIGEAGIHFGVVLAVDASESMTGAPVRAAVAAARTFASRLEQGQRVGVIAFNDRVRVLQRTTSDSGRLTRALSQPPPVAYGTRLYDAAEQAMALLARARLSTASIVLLSDGADVGSDHGLNDVLVKAKAQHVRIFTVGLRSGAFESGPLRRLAAETGGTYAEAASTAALQAIYVDLRQRLAGEYLIRYQSDAAPRSEVAVAVEISGLGTTAKRYTAPTPSGLQPFHRSLLSRFLLSPGSVLVLALLVAALAAIAIVSLGRRDGRSVVDRVEAFSGGTPPPSADEGKASGRNFGVSGRASHWFAGLEQQLEIARIKMPATRVVGLTIVGTIAAVFVLALLGPLFAVLGLLTPLVSRASIARKLKKVRDDFADQLAPNLQVLASALRVGHSFIGALTVVVDNAHEPSRSELSRVLSDERLGVPVEDAVRRVAARMASRDLEQVALLAELQRTAGGNSAEVLDTVVDTLRERADLRRLLRTLTAQGRMARWILTALPIAVGFAMFLLQGELTRPLYQSGVGQLAIVMAALMVVAGSLVIQRIIDIEV